MSSVRAGLLLPTAGALAEQEPQRVVRLATIAEQLGFSSVWVGDHAQWHIPTLEPFSVLAAVAVSTSTVRVGTAVLLLPLRHPLHAARAAATVDRLSGGRLTLGLGVGTDAGGDFRACGVEPSERGRIMDAATETLVRLLAGEEVAERTAWWEVDGRLQPLPVQPCVPLRFGGRADAALRRVARHGDGWIAVFLTPERLAEHVRRLRELCEQEGRGANDVAVAVVVYVEIDDDVREARERAAPHLRALYRTPAERLEAMSAFGPPSLLSDRVSQYAEAGADEIILALASDRVEANTEAAADLLLVPGA